MKTTKKFMKLTKPWPVGTWVHVRWT